MAKIYKTSSTITGRLSSYRTEEITNPSFKHVLNITSNILNYKFIRTDDNNIIYNMTISLEDLKSNEMFASQSFVIPADLAINGFTGSPEEVTLSKSNIVFPLLTTIINKDEILANTNTTWYFSPLRIFIPCALGDFTTFEYSVYNEVGGAEINVEVNSPHTISTELRSWKEFFSIITATTQQATPAVGDTITITVNSSDTSLDMVYVEPIVGIINKTRVKLTNGIGSFSILTSSLQSGDIVDAKINFKQYTGVGRFTKTLS